MQSSPLRYHHSQSESSIDEREEGEEGEEGTEGTEGTDGEESEGIGGSEDGLSGGDGWQRRQQQQQRRRMRAEQLYVEIPPEGGGGADDLPLPTPSDGGSSSTRSVGGGSGFRGLGGVAHGGGEGRGVLIICASERTDVKVGNRHAPYRHHRGDFAFAFALLYTSLAAVLPRVSALLDIAQGPSWEQPGKLSAIVQEHEQEAATTGVVVGAAGQAECFCARARVGVREGGSDSVRAVAVLVSTLTHLLFAPHAHSLLLPSPPPHQVRFNPGWLEEGNDRVVAELVPSFLPTRLISLPTHPSPSLSPPILSPPGEVQPGMAGGEGRQGGGGAGLLVRFNPGWLEEGDDRVVAELVGSQMLPLVLQPGRIILTPYSVYFQPFNVVSSVPVVRHPLRTVTAVMRRSTHLQEIGVEIFYSQWSSIYFTFKSTQDCSRFYSLLLQQPGLSIESMRSQDKWVRDWVSGGISNFDYLMYLNREANRSFNDLSQYPVFPWVIADYTSKELDLTSPATFRDLRKPVGALNPERLEKFRQRYDDLAELYEEWAGNFPEGEVPPHVPGTPSPAFLYGCHYSTPGYVVYVRVRDAPQLMLRLQNGRFDMPRPPPLLHPRGKEGWWQGGGSGFPEVWGMRARAGDAPQLMLRLQNGRFDMPDRLLSSVPEMWEGAYNNPSDLKELIPEFYSLSTSFLLNSQGLDLGVKQDGVPVGDVVLPPWASDAHDFAAKMRQALECPYVSKRLHHWINLVFGCKQRGEAAIEADNVFHPLTYDDIGAQVLASVEDDTVQQALTVQMREFGRTPKQLFTTPHPRQLRKEVRVIHRYVRTASRAMRLPSLFRQSTVDSHIVVQSLSTLNRVSTHRSHLDTKLKSRRGYKTILMGALNPLVELALPDRSVYRAIAQVASGEKDREGQEFGLEWLENTAMYREADMLQISSAKYLLPLMPLALSKRTDQRAAAMRAVAALCKPDANRQFVYSAGFLEPIEAAIVGGYDRGTKAAVDAIAKLSVLPEVVEEFSTAGVLSLVDLLVMSDNSLQAVETQALACEALWRLCGLKRHRLPALGRDVLPRLLPLVRAGEHFTVELREMALRALAAVCVETSSQEEMLQRGGLKEVLEICAMEAGNILEAAIAALAALCRNPELRLQVAVEGGLRLLCNASCAAEAQIQEVAASALQSLLGDGVILNGVIREEGLWSIIAMAQSQHHEVQRLAARAFWYLAIHCENKRQVGVWWGRVRRG
ncbi:unnamed protein product [Closterium sp. Yama58-4]|nr:unnamed protein product [Closterium sp. Yama58-4]